MKLEKGNQYNQADFTANETGHAVHKDGTLCEYNGMPVFAHGKAPDNGKPGQGYFGKTGLCSYTATGKQMGAKEGSIRETRKPHFTLDLGAIFSGTAVEAAPEDAPDTVKNEVKAKRAAQRLRVFADCELEVPGQAESKEFLDWEGLEEVETFAGRAIGKKNLTKAEIFSFMKNNPQKEVVIPAVPASKTTLRNLFTSLGANAKVKVMPAQIGQMKNELCSKLSRDIELVSNHAEGIDSNGDPA